MNHTEPDSTDRFVQDSRRSQITAMNVIASVEGLHQSSRYADCHKTIAGLALTLPRSRCSFNEQNDPAAG